MEGPKDLEMMEESDEDIPSEFSPEVKEILRTDKRLQARIDEFLNQIDLTSEIQDKTEGMLQRVRLLTSMKQDLGEWFSLMLSIPPNAYDKNFFNSKCEEIKARLSRNEINGEEFLKRIQMDIGKTADSKPSNTLKNKIPTQFMPPFRSAIKLPAKINATPTGEDKKVDNEINIVKEVVYVKNKNKNKDDEFQLFKRKRSHKANKEIPPNKKPAAVEPLKTQNKYDALSDLKNSDDPTTGLVNQPVIPPIMLRRTADYKEIIKRLNTVHKINCKAKEAGEFIKLFVETSDDIRKMTKYLDELDKEYFVIASRAEKPIKVVIKGLPINTECEEIKQELIEKGFRVDRVNQLKRFKTRDPLPIFQIHLFKSSNIQDIYKLNDLMYFIIKVEKYINKQNHQCFNCQLWNPGSKGCKLKPKCVICAESRISRDCPKKGKETEVKCANCGGPHTANYRGCPKYPKVAQHTF
ncbi:Nucleic-acid-binding protein transposon like protein [Argiope bruennichi]|uniref:Nucleic-acid-binding protein transposon like protein n=1 Tax=Argiope bruennichi TaxID=94029 RepID=A0A8T0F442_ARGBR|nr:Nucleic-acid-binding protein transposon like protein [Argiope bruennichi]